MHLVLGSPFSVAADGAFVFELGEGVQPFVAGTVDTFDRFDDALWNAPLGVIQYRATAVAGGQGGRNGSTVIGGAGGIGAGLSSAVIDTEPLDAVPFSVGAGGGPEANGADSTLTGLTESILAKGGGSGSSAAGEVVHTGGSGGAGADPAGGGGGASGGPAVNGSAGSAAAGATPGAGGATGSAAGGTGGVSSGNGLPGAVPGAAGGGGGKGSARPALTWIYSVTLPQIDTSGLTFTIDFTPPHTWEHLQQLINSVNNSGTFLTIIIVPNDMPQVVLPLTIINKARLQLFFPGNTYDYAGGDSPDPIIKIDTCSQIVIDGFRALMSTGGHRRGYNIDDSSDIDIKNSWLSGMLDGCVFQSNSVNNRIRLQHFTALNAWGIPGIFGPGTDSGGGCFLSGCTDLTLDDCEFEVGATGHQQCVRIPHPTRALLNNVRARVIAPASKRCYWIYAFSQVQMTNCSAQFQDALFGSTPDQGLDPGSELRIDGFTSRDGPNNLGALKFHCEAIMTDVAARNLTFISPTTPSKCLQIEADDVGNLTHDVGFILAGSTVNGAPMSSANYQIEGAPGGWTPAEAAARNIGPITIGGTGEAGVGGAGADGSVAVEWWTQLATTTSAKVTSDGRHLEVTWVLPNSATFVAPAFIGVGNDIELLVTRGPATMRVYTDLAPVVVAGGSTLVATFAFSDDSDTGVIYLGEPVVLSCCVPYDGIFQDTNNPPRFNNDNEVVVLNFSRVPDPGLQGDIEDPVVTISTPTAGATLTTSPYTYTGTATDDTLVTSMVAFDDTTGWTGPVTNTGVAFSTWSVAVPLTIAGGGSNKIRVRAYDAAGNFGEAEQENFYVPVAPPDTTAPTVDFVLPVASGGEFTTPATTIVFSGVAFDETLLDHIIVRNASTGQSVVAHHLSIWNVLAGELLLVDGSNDITAQSFDATGNGSIIKSIKIISNQIPAPPRPTNGLADGWYDMTQHHIVDPGLVPGVAV